MFSTQVSNLVKSLPLAECACNLLRLIADVEPLNELFDSHRGRGYEKIITFPQMVHLIGDALLYEGGSAYRVFSRAKEVGELPTSMAAVYAKLGRLDIGLSQAFLAERTDPLRSMRAFS